MKHEIEGIITCKDCNNKFEVIWKEWKTNAEFHGSNENIICPYCNSLYATVYVCKCEDVFVRKLV